VCDLRSIVSGEQGNRQSIAVMDSQALRILWCHLPNVSQTITTNPILRVKEGRVLVVTRSVSYLTNKRDKTVLQRKNYFFFRISSKIFVSVTLKVVIPCVVYNTNQVENRPNTTKFYLLYRTTCFDIFRSSSGSECVFKMYLGEMYPIGEDAVITCNKKEVKICTIYL
jgi:hypothetical protein